MRALLAVFAVTLLLYTGLSPGQTGRRAPRGAFRFVDPSDSLIEELERAASAGRWGGVYHRGDGLGFNHTLILHPDGRFAFEWNGCLGTYDQRRGFVKDLGDRLVLGKETYWVIGWGERRYLVEDRELEDFGNAINSRAEPRWEPQGLFYLRREDENKSATGLPDLPERARLMLHAEPLSARVVAVSTPSVVRHEAGFEEVVLDVALDAGARRGVLPKLALRGDFSCRLDVYAVSPASSSARCSLFSRGRHPREGDLVSTLPAGKAKPDPLGGRASLIEIKSSEGRRPPIENLSRHRMTRFSGKTELSGAAEAGFDVRPVGVVRALAASGEIARSNPFEAATARAVVSLGGNAYVGLPGGELAAYRIEYDGAPVGEGFYLPTEAFLSGPRDWALAAAGERRDRSAFGRAVRAAMTQAGAELLGLTPAQFDGLEELSIESLTDEQRERLKRYLGVQARAGTVGDAERKTAPEWHARYWAARDAARARLMAEDRAAYERHLDLEFAYDDLHHAHERRSKAAWEAWKREHLTARPASRSRASPAAD